MKYIILILSSLWLIGCNIKIRQAPDPGKLCIDKGGIPIYSSWDGTLKDCKFKN